MDSDASPAAAFARPAMLSRRGLLRAGGLGLTGAGAALLFGCGGDDGPKPLPNEPLPPPEVTRIRFPAPGDVCIAPIYVAAMFFPDEGLQVEYVPDAVAITDLKDKVDFTYDFAASVVLNADQGRKFTALGGVHAGCFELLVARDDIRTIGDLRGKKVAVDVPVDFGGPNFVSSLLAYVGIPPEHTIVYVPTLELVERLERGEIDAVLSVPPTGTVVRASKLKRIVLDSSTDSPFSQYVCCLLEANTKFVARNPVTTKRVMRAIARAADFCATNPEDAARYMVAGGYTDWVTDEVVARTGVDRYHMALETVGHLPYDIWRRYDPEDSLRFYALRMKDAGNVKITADVLIKRHTDWRFLNALKQEMPQTAFAPHTSSGFALNCETGPLEPPLAAAVPRPAADS